MGENVPRLLSLARLAFFASIALAIIPKGSVTPLSLNTSAAIIALIFLTALVWSPRKTAIARLYRQCFTIALLLGAYIFAQSMVFEGNPFAHPIWAAAGKLLSFTHGAVSIDPSTTRLALVTFAAPVLAFLAALALFQGDAGGLTLWRFLAIAGAAFAAYGFLRLSLFPDTLLFYEKTYHNSSLASFFVNRNNAGTLLGVASLLQLGLVMRQWQERKNRFGWATLFWATLLIATLTALFMTNSRGAALATLAGYLAAGPLAMMKRGDPSSNRHLPGASVAAASLARFGLIAAWIGCVVLVFLVFAGGAVLRMELQAFDDGRFCILPGLWRAFTENWMFGTGFGTFQTIFPQYKDPACGVYSIWQRAHSFYLEGLIGLGVPFLAVLIAVYTIFSRTLARGMSSRRSMRFAPAIGIGVVCLITVHGLFDFSLQIHGVAVFVAAAMGAIATLSLGRVRSTGRQPEGEDREPRRA